VRKFPLRPAHPERLCWGCDLLCPAEDMRCGNGTERAQHPLELWGADWMSFGCEDGEEPPQEAAAPPVADGGQRRR
jgi:Protein of unknown function (DUF3079)